MKLCIDWKAVCQDWKTSGLSKNRYFLSGRLEKFIRAGLSPCYSTFLRHLRSLEKSLAILQESSEFLPLQTENRSNAVAVHRLTSADIKKVTATPRTAVGTRLDNA